MAILLQNGTDALLLETSDGLLLEGPESGWNLGIGWSIGSGIAICDGTQPASTIMSQELVTEIGIEYAIEFELSAYAAGSVSVEFDGIEVIAAKSANGTYNILATPTTATATIIFIADYLFDGSIDNVKVRRAWWLDTSWIKDTISLSGQPSNDSPSSVKLKYTSPSEDEPNWQNTSAIRTLAEAATGAAPFVQTGLSQPGVQNKSEALNKAVQRLSRMYKRVALSYETTDVGVRNRIGDVVQLVNSSRGADLRIWVETVDFVDYGRYRVSGIFYDELHFSNGLFMDVYSCSAVYDAMIFLDPTAYWPLYDGPQPIAKIGGVRDHSTHNNNNGVVNETNNNFYTEPATSTYDAVLDECAGKTSMFTDNNFAIDALFILAPPFINAKSSGTLMYVVKNRSNQDGRYSHLKWSQKVGPANQNAPFINVGNHDNGIEITLSTPTDEANGGLDFDLNGKVTFENILGDSSKAAFILVRFDFQSIDPETLIEDVKVDVWVNGVKRGGKIWGGKGEAIETNSEWWSGMFHAPDGNWNHNAYWDYWINDETIAIIQKSVERNMASYSP